MTRRLELVGKCPKCGQTITLRGGVTVGHKYTPSGWSAGHRAWCIGGIVPVGDRRKRVDVPRSDGVR